MTEKEGEKKDYQTVNCLTHILHCWNANLKRYDAAGPSFLVHFLEGRYEHAFGFRYLEGEDGRQVRVLREACSNTHAFEVFLARFWRRVKVELVESSGSKGGKTMDKVHTTKCGLEDVVHAGGKEVKIQPSVSEADLLNEYYFEDEDHDVWDEGEGWWEECWSRTVR
jgi:hypothetical protein